MRYDDTALPSEYDRARARSPEVLSAWTARVAEYAPEASSVRTILDLGCGTGRFSQALHAQFSATVVGVDPSANMLRRASTKCRTPFHQFVRGTGEAIPLKDSSVDLVFMSMVFHHFADVARAVDDCRRVLRSRGCVFLRAGTKDRIRSYPTSKYFPASVAIMERTLWSVEGTCRAFESAGFRTVHTGTVDQTIAPSHAAYVEQLAAGGDSILAQLDAADFDAGIAELRTVATTVDPRPVREPIDFLVFA